jgi:hypothetical protein
VLTVKPLLVAVILMAFGTTAAVPPTTANKNSIVNVSIPHVNLQDGERVVSFQVELTAGMVRSVSNLPKGWYVAVDNDASWRTQVKGNTLVGAAAMSAQELENVRIAVEKDETYMKFSLQATIAATKDFEKERRITLSMKDFSVGHAE